ncbi:SGNH/GDSL hydrolase family protein [Salinibacterium sp. SWN167]|uniref:SGNH/GDSL hydrolase family protein n=1 Tax=Salinibacterium sp. SWN167 TaxID=2792054 RepID=UPI0018CEC848|nr:SGNH/GDSL hydrolase family protein [Salinibacterium sp. SWN167]MBH0083943.1 SGNH/GDSL hydrolase family protein [Salinibacterium sp. SWN167]
MKFDSVARIIATTVVVAAALSLSACSSEEPAAERDPNEVRVAFYGDSYTLGTGASASENRWSTVISEQRGWSEFNPSVNGLGFINNRSAFGDGDLPSMIIADDPDIVIVTMGLNDNFSFDARASDIRTQISADFDRLTTALPDARFIVVEPFWYTDERPESVETIIGWVEAAASDSGADYIAGASHWIEGHPEWMASDGLHPNNEGYAAMASEMDQALRTLGL